MHAFPHEANQQALSWLKSALTETLGEASRALETFSKDTADSSPLQQCLGCLQQIASTLQMLELKDANLLAAEIGTLGQSILNHRLKASVPVLEELSRGIMVLQGYLRYLEAGKKGCPLSVLAALNDLRVARGESPQIAVDLFDPDLAAPLPPSLGTAIALEDAAFRSLAAQLRLHYEVALLQWFRDPNGGGLSLLAQVITQLRQHSGSKAPLRLWWLAQGVIEALQEGGLYISQEIKLLLGSLDRYIKILAQEGEPALAVSIPATLLKSLLFQVAHATSSGTEVTTIKAAYGLESCSPATLFAMEATEAVLTHLGSPPIGFEINCRTDHNRGTKRR
jgi:chemosensory pili system protein ChpA (sensor histidine kinase/response regulator)